MTSSRTLLVAAVVAALHGPAAGAQTSGAPGPNTWTIDPNHTSAQFAVRHLLVSTVRGHFENVSGTIEWDGKDVRTLAVHVTIDAASVNTRVANRDNDLRSANFFEVEKYPSITFASKRAEQIDDSQFRLVGDLTIRGVTREVTLDVEGPMVPIGQGPVLRTGATATTKIDRRDFGLLYGRMVEGAAVVGDEVTITIDVEAVRRAN